MALKNRVAGWRPPRLPRRKTDIESACHRVYPAVQALEERLTMRTRFYLAIALVCCIPIAALAQSQPASTVRTLLATGRIGSVVGTPLAFRLLSVRLPAAQQASYSGPNAMLYAVSSGLRVCLGGDSRPVAEGGGVFIPAGQAANLSVSGQEPAHFLIFVLSPA